MNGKAGKGGGDCAGGAVVASVVGDGKCLAKPLACAMAEMMLLGKVSGAGTGAVSDDVDAYCEEFREGEGFWVLFFLGALGDANGATLRLGVKDGPDPGPTKKH